MNVPETPIIHQFSRKHAGKWGIPEAIFVAYAAKRTRTSKNIKSGERWFYNTVEELQTRYPYWPEGTLDGIIRRCRNKKLIKVGNFNSWAADKTRWFTVPDEIRDMAAEDPVYFYIEDAKRYGVRSALVLFNLESNIQKRMKKDPKDVYHPLVPSQLAKLLPISKRELERIIKELREADAIVQLRPNFSFYTFPKLLKPAPPDPGMTPSLPGTTPSDPGQTPPKQGQTPPDPGSNTHYKPLEAIEAPLKEPFETPQAAPAASSSPSSSGQADNLGKNCDVISISLGDHFFLCNYKDLEDRCKQIKEKHAVALDKFITQSVAGCEHFIDSLSSAAIYELAQVGNRDDLLRCILPQLSAFFDDTLPADKLTPPLRFNLFTICLDLLITAFLRLGTHQREDTAVYAWQQQSYQLCLKMLPIANTEEARRDRTEFEEARKSITSPDADKEEVGDLAPAEKARVLKRAVEARNAAGWFMDYDILTTNFPRRIWNKLVFSHSALAMAERFFAQNRDATVAEVIDVLDRCVEMSELSKGNATVADSHRSTRKALDVSYFFTNAESVLKELGIGQNWASCELQKQPDTK